MDATTFLTERPRCPGQLSAGQCDAFYHREQWETLLRVMRRFPDDYDMHRDLGTCVVCGVNVRDPKNHPTIEDYDKREEEFEAYEKAVRQWLKMTHKSKNHKEMGPRELTLTYSPKWEGFSDEHAQEVFRTAEEKLLKYYKNELVQYRSVGEYTKAGCSHLHIMYTLVNGGKFTDKNIKRAYPKWDAKKCMGGHHSLVKSVSDFAGYLEKSLNDNWHYYDYNNASLQTSSNGPPSSSQNDASSPLPHSSVRWVSRPEEVYVNVPTG